MLKLHVHKTDDFEDYLPESVLNESQRKERAYKILDLIEQLEENEMVRIYRTYEEEKEFTVEQTLNLYKIYLILFDNRTANKQILDFIKKKNVSKSSSRKEICVKLAEEPSHLFLF